MIEQQCLSGLMVRHVRLLSYYKTIIDVYRAIAGYYYYCSIYKLFSVFPLLIAQGLASVYDLFRYPYKLLRIKG